MIVRLRAAAAADLVEIYRYLADRSHPGAGNVVRAIQLSIDNIAQQPFASQATDDLSVRIKIVQRYPYKIFYEITEAGVAEILHIRHTSRRPWAVEK
jgi:plasmid stabilization system protein ParE